MTDDLVKRLRDNDAISTALSRIYDDEELRYEAAERIEKLEAALNCNLPDYDPKIGIVERLRQLGNWRVDGTKSSPIYNKSADYIEKLEALLHDASEFLDNYSDVIDGLDGQPEANDAMILKQEIDRVLENKHD